MSNKLFVGNISFNTTENDLQDAFAAHDTIVKTNLMIDHTTNHTHKFNFITINTPEETQKTITTMNNTTINNHNLTINIAHPHKKSNNSNKHQPNNNDNGDDGHHRDRY